MSGLALVWLSSLWFAAAGLLVKALGPGVPASLVSLCRNAIALPLVYLLMRRAGVPVLGRNLPRLLLRGALSTLANVALFWALPRMPLANAMLLSYSAPIYAVVWGTVFLGERMGRFARACAALAALGVWASWRPDTALEAGPYLAALLSGLLGSLALVTVKTLTREEHNLRILFYFAAVGAAMLIPSTISAGYWPTPAELALLALISATATVGQLLLTWGLARAPVSQAGLGTLFVIVLNVAGGWLFWGEVPDGPTWLGCLLIGAGVAGLSIGLPLRLKAWLLE